MEQQGWAGLKDNREGKGLTLAGGTGLQAGWRVLEDTAVPMQVVPAEGPQLCGPSFGQLLPLFM